MRYFFTFLLALVMMQAGAAGRLVYVLDLQDEVGPAMWMHARKVCDEATRANADVLVVHVNTYGGAVAEADSIRTALMRMQMPTVAYVDPNAASAGALITLACDTVYMSPGASYGATVVVNGQGDVMPDKYQSYMRAVMRATAESHGKVMSAADSSMVWRRNPDIAEGMVMPDRVLTLSPDSALACGYSEGTVGSLRQVIDRCAGPEPRVERIEQSATHSILGFFSNAVVRAALVMLILAGLYMEMHTPGLGVAGGIAFVAAVLYFLPAIVAGAAPAWVVLAFIVGLVLLALEIFVIPGFGVCGVAGILCIVASLFGAMLGDGVASGTAARQLTTALVVVPSGALLAVALVWYLTSRHGPRWVRRTAELHTSLTVHDGYIGIDPALGAMVGQEARAVTDLRPSGKIEIAGVVYDAVSTGPFIEAGRQVKVVKYENAQLYVAPQRL